MALNHCQLIKIELVLEQCINTFFKESNLKCYRFHSSFNSITISFCYKPMSSANKDLFMHVDMSSLHESDTGLPVSPSSNSKLNDEISV